jgi:hypothetical protein
MLGFVFGTLCLLGLAKVLRHGGGWGGRGWGHHHHHHHRGGRGLEGFGSRRMLRGLFERLDTSPGQERVIADAARELADAARPLRDEVAASRRDVAAALRSPTVDAETLGELFARHDEALREARKRAVGALARVHEALDERQRESLAALLERRWGGACGRGAGPYRGAHGLAGDAI